YTDQVHIVHFAGFGALKNAGVERAHGDWIMLCDADERVTPRLAREFMTAVQSGTDRLAFRTPTVNFFWGRRMNQGGWREEHIKIVKRDYALHEGDVHERLSIPRSEEHTSELQSR